ncbi:MAG: hypothetical protein ACKO40_09380 [Planctomycetaceae bacterium]
MPDHRTRRAAGFIAAILLFAISSPLASSRGDEPAADGAADGAVVDESVDAVAPPDAAADQPADSGEEATPVEPAAVEEPRTRPAAAPTDRVRLKLDVTGEIFAPAGKDAPPLRLPTSIDAMFDFTELPLRTTDSTDPTVERRYADAVAELRVDGVASRMSLARDARVVRVVLRGTTPSPFLERGFLTRDELDLLEVPFDPLLAAAIRPGRDVAAGETWTIAADDAAGLLSVDTVESGSLEATLDEVVDGTATVTITGIIDGAADGVPTHVTVEGSCTLPADDTAEGRYTLDDPPRSAAVTIRERREAGHVAPGFDVEARVSFVRAAVTADDRGGDGTPVDAAAAPRGDAAGRPGLVWHHDPHGRFDIVHETGWRTIEDGPDGLVMRLVDHGALVAQCSIAALPRSSAATPPTIADVERDLARSLAGQFSAVEHSSEATRTDGVTIVRVVAAGRAGDLPFRWIHAVLTDGQGHRLAVTCLLEASLAERFGDADRRLVDGIRLPAAQPAGPDASRDREARLPQDSRTP